MNPLTKNDVLLKNFPEAVNENHSIPAELFDFQDYSFDTPFFTNLTLSNTIKSIFWRVYKHKRIVTKFRKKHTK